jgi:hypothetical protein
MKFGLAASSVAGQTMQLVGAEDAFTVSRILSTSVNTHIFFRFRKCYDLIPKYSLPSLLLFTVSHSLNI